VGCIIQPEQLVKYGELCLRENEIAYADPGFFRLFDFELLNLAMYDGKFITVNNERCFHITDVFLLIDSSKVTREEVIKMMKAQFLANPTIFGFNTGWEPNAFDGKDAEYAGKVPYDASGRFVPYMTRKSSNEILLEALVDYDKEGPGDYYQLPKKNAERCHYCPLRLPG
jgi:hypothetical protein